MSTDSKATYALTIPVSIHNQQIINETQYGMKFPDGTIRWGMLDPNIGDYHAVAFKDIAAAERGISVGSAGASYSVQNWATYLKKQATAANISVEDYAEMHTLVKRTLVLAATAAEEV